MSNTTTTPPAQKQTLLEFVNMTLHNNEVSSDEELVEYFMTEGPMTEEMARKAVAQRHCCFVDMFYEVTL